MRVHSQSCYPNPGSRLVGASNLGKSFSVSESSIQHVLQGGVWSSFSFPSSHEIDADVALSGS